MTVAETDRIEMAEESDERTKDAYTAAGVPVYLVADPYSGKCHVFRDPREGVYGSELTVLFGTPIDLTGTPVGVVLRTDEFPRD